MISVEEARQNILSSLEPVSTETVSLNAASGRILAEDIRARRTQPPADMSAMDGYAVKAEDVKTVPVSLKVVGEAPAGGSYDKLVQSGEAVRIFTGGPLPEGTDAIVIQEDTDRDGDTVLIKESSALGKFVRKAGIDFKEGDIGLQAGKNLTPRDVGLLAAMNI
ncbi:MAG: hypothetical protein MI743_07070, partial [Sneathiellales bacterium]|nr:hypothetical protein [Sneathiellales bacterium]